MSCHLHATSVGCLGRNVKWGPWSLAASTTFVRPVRSSEFSRTFCMLHWAVSALLSVILCSWLSVCTESVCACCEDAAVKASLGLPVGCSLCECMRIILASHGHSQWSLFSHLHCGLDQCFPTAQSVNTPARSALACHWLVKPSSPSLPDPMPCGGVHFLCCRHNAKAGKCAVCEQSTVGIFNVAHDIVKRMKKAKKT